MRVICCQTDIVWARKEANFGRVEDLLAASSPAAGGLIVLPEMFATGFVLDDPGLAEDLDQSPTIEFLGNLAASTGNHILAGLLVRSGTDVTNDAVLIAPDRSLAGRYSKIHPFSAAGESKIISAGNRVTCLPLGEWSLAPFICYDLRFPEIFREVNPGAQLVAVIANWPARREAHWVSLLQARAIENQAYVVGVNRSGSDPDYAYGGRSLIIDPLGKVLEDAGDKELCISADLDLSLVNDWRSDFPVRDDRRDLNSIQFGFP